MNSPISRDIHILSFSASCLNDVSQLKSIALVYALFCEKHPYIITCGAFHSSHKILISFAEKTHSHSIADITEILDEITKIHIMALETLFEHNTQYEKFIFFKQEIENIIKKIHALLRGISLIKEISEQTIFLLDMYASHLASLLIQACVFYTHNTFIKIIANETANENGRETTSENTFEKNSIVPLPSLQHQKHITLTNIISHQTKALHIWTQQGGIMTANPEIIPTAFPVHKIDYDTALEIGYLGGKILHPSIIKMLREQTIPISVYSMHNPETPTSIIQHIPQAQQTETIFAITERDNISLLTIKSTKMFDMHGYLEKIFKVFSHFKIPVETLSTSEISVTLTFSSEHYSDTFKTKLSQLGTIEFFTEQTIISIIGNRVWKNPVYIAKAFGVLEGYSLNMLSLGQAGSTLNLVCDTKHNREIITHLHRVLFEDD